jgi:effector-binding domain-containing protein
VTYDITVEHIEPQRAAAMRGTTTPAEIGPALAQILPTIGRAIQEQEVKPAGAPFCRYFSFSPEKVELEGGIAVQSPIRPFGEVQDIELPGGEVVTTWHIGPYEKLGGAWDALRAWLAEQGREPAGPGWEVYWTDPGEVSDPNDLRTQIIWPLR